MLNQLAGIATGTALGVALSLAVTAQPAEASQLSAPDPVCGYDVYQGKVYVQSLSVRGKITVALKDNEQTSSLVGRKQIKPNQVRTFSVPRNTSNDDVLVWVTRGNKRLGYCEPA